MLPHICPRCGTDTVNVCRPPRRAVPLVTTFWCSVIVGAILIGLGAAPAAAVVAIGLNAAGVAATTAHTCQLWYRCNGCNTSWYEYPWQRSQPT